MRGRIAALLLALLVALVGVEPAHTAGLVRRQPALIALTMPSTAVGRVLPPDRSRVDQAQPAHAADLTTLTCPTYGFTLTLPPSWTASGPSCATHVLVAASDHLSTVALNVYAHPPTTPDLIQRDLQGWLAPFARAGHRPICRNISITGGTLVTCLITIHGPHTNAAVFAETYRDGRLYMLTANAVDPQEYSEVSFYTEGIFWVLLNLKLMSPTGPLPPPNMDRTTLGAPLSRFERDLGPPSTYTPSANLYGWRSCSAGNHEVVEARFSHGVAFRIAVLNCSQVNLPNYLSLIGALLPVDAVPIGTTTSAKLGQLSLFYSQQLHDSLPAPLRADRANLHDCSGKAVAAGTLFVGQANGVIAVGLGGCES